MTSTQGTVIPWFPRRRHELDVIAGNVLDAGTDLHADHPGFNDRSYRARREALSEIAASYRDGQPIPHIEYTAEERRTWAVVYEMLRPLAARYACDEYLALLPLMQRSCGYGADTIPQLADVDRFLMTSTGFRIWPVRGLLSPRDFLYGLAHRVFFSTQFLRHHAKPHYTPEPDLVHELLGHAPLLADASFADFSQEIGLAAIGATEDQVTQLDRCYWYSVEFGLCKSSSGELRAYGAGLLSSGGELRYAMSDGRILRPWDPHAAAKQDHPITSYQPVYYVADSFEDAKRKQREFTRAMRRPFAVSFDAAEREIRTAG